MVEDPLLTTLLDIEYALGWAQKLIIGGGYGLFLKQLYLKQHPEIATLFSFQELPEARVTKDIDLVLRAEIVTDSGDLRVAARSRRVVDHEIAVRGSTDHREGLDGETTYRAALVAAGEIPDCHAPLLRPPF